MRSKWKYRTRPISENEKPPQILLCTDYTEIWRVRRVFSNQPRRRRRAARGKVNSSWRREPANTQAPESQKLSQTYSRQRRVLRAGSLRVSVVFARSADQPSSPL